MLPRLLLISQEIPQSVNAGGILLKRLLEGYPEERLLVIGAPPAAEASLLRCPYHVFAPVIDRLLRTRFSSWVSSIQAAGILASRLPQKLSAIADAFQPDVVMTVFQSYAFYSAARSYAKTKKVPLLLVSYDDPLGFSTAPEFFRRLETKRDRVLYRAATRRLVVSSEMDEEFSNRYGARGHVVYPIPSERIHARSLESCRTLRKPGLLTIGYAGTLAYGYGPQLKRMLPAFSDGDAVLRIYSKASPDWERAPVWSYNGFAQTAEMTWQRIQEECDAVILPYCWPDDGHEILYRTHFPSKLPEYLALGMPVIVMGPPYATGVRWAESHPQAALAITENDSRVASTAFRRLKDDPELRMSLAGGALKAWAIDFNPAQIRETFIQHVRDTSQCDPKRTAH